MSDDIAPVRSIDFVSERLAEIDCITNDLAKVKALVELASQLLPSPSEVLAEALQAANAIQDDEYARARALAAIAPQLPETERVNVLGKALSAANAIQTESDRASVLVAIAPRLTENDLQLVQQALSAAQTIQHESDRASVLVAIAPHLPATEPQLLQQVLVAAQDIKEEWLRAKVLTAIAPRLPPTEPRLLQQGLIAIESIESCDDRAKALVAIAFQLSGTERIRALEQAFQSAQGIQNGEIRARVLAAIAHKLPQVERLKALEQALTSAQSIQDDVSLANLLISIAPQFIDTELQLLQRVLTAAQSIQDEDYRAKALAAIVPQLLKDKLQLLQQGLTAVQSIKDEECRAKGLTVMVSQLLETEPQLLERMLFSIQDIQNEKYRAPVLAALAPRLTETEGVKTLEQALMAVQLMADENIYIDPLTTPITSQLQDTLIAITPYLPTTEPQLLQHALTITGSIRSGDYRAGVLAAIAPYLPTTEPQLLQHALTVAQGIKYEEIGTNALIALLLQLPSTELHSLQQVLTAAQSIQNEEYRTKVLVAITLKLPATEPYLLQQALTTAQSIQNREYRANVLALIASQLSETSRSRILEQALTTAQSIQDQEYYANALALIAPHLPETRQFEVWRQALTAVQSIKEWWSRTKVLTAIVPQLPKNKSQLLTQAFIVVQSIKDDASRGYALATIAHQLPKTELVLLQQVLAAVQTIQDGGSRAKALTAIAPRLSETERFEVLQQVLTVAQSVEEGSRAEVLAAIAHSLRDSPHLLEQALTVAQSIQEQEACIKALTAIAPQLQEPEHLKVLKQVLKVVQFIQNEEYRASTLVSIAPRLPESEPQLLQQALSAAQTILQDEDSCASALAAIAPQLPETKLPELLKTTSGLSQEKATAVLKSPAIRFTEALVVQFPSNKHSVALEIVKALPQDTDKTKFLSALVPHLSLGLLPNALRLIQDAFTQDADRAEAFSNLVPYLPIDQLPEALQLVTRSIKTPRHQTTALENLIPYLSFQDFHDVLNLLEDHSEAQSEGDPTIAVETKVITEPKLRAKILRSIATALSTKPIDAESPQTPPSSELEGVITPQLQKSETKLLQQALSAALEIQNEYDRAHALVKIIPQLPESERFNVMQQALSTALTIQNKYDRAHALAEIAPCLPESERFNVLEQALGEAQTIEDGGYRARVLAVIAPHLPESEQFNVMQQALSTAQAIYDKDDRARVLAAIASQLPEQVKIPLLIDKIFKLVDQLKTCQQKDFSYPKEAASILSQVAPALSCLSDVQQKNVSETVQQFLETVQQFEDPGYQVQILSAFAAYFPKAVDRFLTTCSGDDYRALLNIKVQLALASKLDIQKLKEIDDTLKTIEGRYRKAEALVEIASHPAGSDRQTQALRTIRNLSNTYLKVQYLERLTPHLLDNQRLETANIIREIPDSYYRAKAFIALACKSPEFRTEAKTVAQALENRIQRIEQLSALAVEVPEILPDIIDVAEQSGEPIERKEILVALAPHLPMRINREVDRERAAGRPITNDLWDRALYLLARGYRDALQGGSLRSESAQDKDFLSLRDEVNALADLLLMRDLEPPMTVGILGGWGGGKSYIMHLMQTHVTEVRSRSVTEAEAWNDDPNHEKLSPYVGHIYQIKFDAWTFAKADLWASLMQTIFFELDRQLTLETKLTAILKDIPRSKRDELESKIWAVLYKTSDVDRQWFLERVLTDKTLLEQLSQYNQAETTGQLWKTLNSSQQEAIEQLKKTQQQLEIARRDLDAQKAAIRKEINDQFAPLLKIETSQNFKRVDALLGTSFILLRQRIGPQLFKHFQNEIYRKLYEDLGNTSESNKQPVGLWQELSNTLEDLEKAKKELAKLQLSQDAPTSPTPSSNTTSPGNTETSPVESSDPVTEKSQTTQEDIEKNIEDLFQKAEGLKLDIQTVAANVIEQQYWRVSWNSGWQWVTKNWLLLLIFLCFFISPLLLWKVFQINPIAIGTATIEQLLTRIAAILAPTLPALVTLQSLLRSSHKWFEETQLALHEYEKSVENRNKQVEITIETTIQERLQKNDELQQLERHVRQLETQVEQQKQALPVNEYASLNDFVSDRLSSKTYANRLGLMQQVKEDLFDLSNKLLPPNGQSLESKIKFLKDTFPRGPARVIVYIDDLDRCPPDRVVQVLEAVQLLVKTPLFIAVLAIDERYITRALEKFYEGVLSRRGRPSGTDYLEKIIQLPYRVRPIMASTLESYLRSQVVIQDSATGGAKFSEFSRQEFNMLLACCQQVDLSPRTLKRLTNVYKLFKIVCRTRGTKPNLQVQQSILALLALSGRYPNLMRSIFDSIETCFEEQRTPEKAKTSQTLHLRSPLRNFFEQYRLSDGDRHLQRDFEKLKHDALQTSILPAALTLDDMTHEIFNLIRSFSFVGEIGEDPEDYRFNDPTANEKLLENEVRN